VSAKTVLQRQERKTLAELALETNLHLTQKFEQSRKNSKAAPNTTPCNPEIALSFSPQFLRHAVLNIPGLTRKIHSNDDHFFSFFPIRLIVFFVFDLL
jgi:hypothetical protein